MLKQYSEGCMHTYTLSQANLSPQSFRFVEIGDFVSKGMKRGTLSCSSGCPDDLARHAPDDIAKIRF